MGQNCPIFYYQIIYCLKASRTSLLCSAGFTPSNTLMIFPFSTCECINKDAIIAQPWSFAINTATSIILLIMGLSIYSKNFWLAML